MNIPTHLIPLLATTAIGSTLVVLLLPAAAAQLIRGHPLRAARTVGAALICAVVVVLAAGLAASTLPAALA